MNGWQSALWEKGFGVQSLNFHVSELGRERRFRKRFGFQNFGTFSQNWIKRIGGSFCSLERVENLYLILSTRLFLLDSSSLAILPTRFLLLYSSYRFSDSLHQRTKRIIRHIRLSCEIHGCPGSFFFATRSLGSSKRFERLRILGKKLRLAYRWASECNWIQRLDVLSFRSLNFGIRSFGRIWMSSKWLSTSVHALIANTSKPANQTVSQQECFQIFYPLIACWPT